MHNQWLGLSFHSRNLTQCQKCSSLRFTVLRIKEKTPPPFGAKMSQLLDLNSICEKWRTLVAVMQTFAWWVCCETSLTWPKWHIRLNTGFEVSLFIIGLTEYLAIEIMEKNTVFYFFAKSSAMQLFLLSFVQFQFQVLLRQFFFSAMDCSRHNA